jgi:hypothetical protein
VFLTELLGKSSAHDLAANAGRSLEMSLTALAARRANVYVRRENEQSALVVNFIVEMSASGQNGV